MSSSKSLVAYVNGEFVLEEHAKISVYDRGFTYGDGCFEGIAVYKGKAVQLDEHIDRLYRSAKSLYIEISIQKEEVKRIVKELLERNDRLFPGKIYYLRIILTRGAGPLGLEATSKIRTPTLVMIPAGDSVGTYPREATRSEYLEKGIKARIVSLRRTPPESLDPRIKSLNYLNNVLAKIEAIESGCQDAILLDMNGFVAEAPGANIFVVNSNTLYTPLPTKVLHGITRDKVINLAEGDGLKVVEANLTVYDLLNADEIFLTGSLAHGLAPVVVVNGVRIGSGSPGPVTRKLQDLWKKFVESHV